MRILEFVDGFDSASAPTITSLSRASIAAGTADHVVINSAAGALSSEATLAKSRGGTGANNSSVTFPSSGIIVTRDASETLNNKTLTGPNIATINNTGALTLPTSTDTLVGRATTDTLTNKTIAAGSNTISGLANANMSAAAGIAVDKIAALTASRAAVTNASGFLAAATTTSTEIGFVNGVTSAIQTQLDAKTLKATLTAKGSIYVATAAGTPAELLVGTNGFMPVANSSASTGIEWKNIGATVSSSFVLTNWPITVDQYGDLIAGGISLAAGTWILSTVASVAASGGATTTNEIQIGISTTTGNSGTGLAAGNTMVTINSAAFASGNSRSLVIPTIVVTPASTTTYYMKGFAETSIVNLKVAGRITAVRIA